MVTLIMQMINSKNFFIIKAMILIMMMSADIRNVIIMRITIINKYNNNIFI